MCHMKDSTKPLLRKMSNQWVSENLGTIIQPTTYAKTPADAWLSCHSKHCSQGTPTGNLPSVPAAAAVVHGMDLTLPQLREMRPTLTGLQTHEQEKQTLLLLWECKQPKLTNKTIMSYTSLFTHFYYVSGPRRHLSLQPLWSYIGWGSLCWRERRRTVIFNCSEERLGCQNRTLASYLYLFGTG